MINVHHAMAALVAAACVLDAQPAAPPRDAVLKAAREVIASVRYATLSTMDDLSGYPQARVVDPFAPESDFTIWIGTNAETRKVQQVRLNPRVALLYFDSAKQHYVSITGVASIVRDAAEKSRRFKPDWKAFYKNGSNGDDYVLIKIVPSRLEIVADSLGMRNDPVTWRPVTIALP